MSVTRVVHTMCAVACVRYKKVSSKNAHGLSALFVYFYMTFIVCTVVANHRCRPFPKFLCIKGVVFMVRFWYNIDINKSQHPSRQCHLFLFV